VATLIIKYDNREIASYDIDTSIIIGRSPDSDIQLEDKAASETHALIDKEDGGFILRDLGSTNGTFLNREKISEAKLKSGDIIIIGRHLLLFQ